MHCSGATLVRCLISRLATLAAGDLDLFHHIVPVQGHYSHSGAEIDAVSTVLAFEEGCDPRCRGACENPGFLFHERRRNTSCACRGSDLQTDVTAPDYDQFADPFEGSLDTLCVSDGA